MPETGLITEKAKEGTASAPSYLDSGALFF